MSAAADQVRKDYVKLAGSIEEVFSEMGEEIRKLAEQNEQLRSSLRKHSGATCPRCQETEKLLRQLTELQQSGDQMRGR